MRTEPPVLNSEEARMSPTIPSSGHSSQSLIPVVIGECPLLPFPTMNSEYISPISLRIPSVSTPFLTCFSTYPICPDLAYLKKSTALAVST